MKSATLIHYNNVDENKIHASCLIWKTVWFLKTTVCYFLCSNLGTKILPVKVDIESSVKKIATSSYHKGEKKAFR